MCSFVTSLAEDLFLAGDLDCCTIVGGPTIKISRVADLGSFFDEISALEWNAETNFGDNVEQARAVIFSPIDGNAVGAIVNGTTIAKA